MGLYVAGAVSAGGITTALAARVLRRTGDRHADEPTPEGRRDDR
jgi:hypothetical protein